ncbi:hypothetical protein FOA52_010566 [Chlamydomonas sp. UWO 241]|nr:hypothetical protein FOA52_010566 [Chlamydomonas sp. UWO 241]
MHPLRAAAVRNSNSSSTRVASSTGNDAPTHVTEKPAADAAAASTSQEEVEDDGDPEMSRLVKGVFTAGLNFIIVFFLAFMVPSVFPKALQESLGLPGITAGAALVAAGIVFVTSQKSEDGQKTDN